jgi:dephospho-CoA kinase
MLIGLTGGVGSGKSTVAALLAGHGAVVIDADKVAREVVEPGTPGHAAIAERFGPAGLAIDGSLDRAAIAAVVFADPAALADLNAIVHPLVAARSGELLTAARAAGATVVYDVPLLVESGTLGRFDFDRIVVVEAGVETRVRRLVARGLSEADARSRIAVQASDEQRRAIADEVLANDGDRDALTAAVDRLWERLQPS